MINPNLIDKRKKPKRPHSMYFDTITPWTLLRYALAPLSIKTQDL
jgi:hypothetical protein